MEKLINTSSITIIVVTTILLWEFLKYLFFNSYYKLQRVVVIDKQVDFCVGEDIPDLNNYYLIVKYKSGAIEKVKCDISIYNSTSIQSHITI